MSTKETTIEPTVEPVTDPELEGHNTPEAVEPETIEPESTDQGNPNKEAAKFRRQAREAQAAQTALADQLDALRRTMISNMIETEHRVAAAGVWATTPNTADYLGEDGAPDPAKVRTLTNTAVEALGLTQRARSPRPDPNQGQAVNHQPTGSWSGFLSGSDD